MTLTRAFLSICFFVSTANEAAQAETKLCSEAAPKSTAGAKCTVNEFMAFLNRFQIEKHKPKYKFFLPVSLKCDTENNGLQEFVLKNPEGGQAVFRGRFEEGEVKVIYAAHIEPGGYNEIVHFSGSPAELSSSGHAGASFQKDLSTKLRTDICLGPPAVRAEFGKVLADNRLKTSSVGR